MQAITATLLATGWLAGATAERLALRDGLGEPIVAVVAETGAIAREAAAKVRVDYEDLSAVFEVEEALRPETIVVNPKHVFTDATVMPAFYRTDGLNRVRPEFQGKPILTATELAVADPAQVEAAVTRALEVAAQHGEGGPDFSNTGSTAWQSLGPEDPPKPR